MDATEFLRAVFDTVPAHWTAGLSVHHAVDGVAAVELRTPGH